MMSSNFLTFMILIFLRQYSQAFQYKNSAIAFRNCEASSCPVWKIWNAVLVGLFDLNVETSSSGTTKEIQRLQMYFSTVTVVNLSHMELCRVLSVIQLQYSVIFYKVSGTYNFSSVIDQTNLLLNLLNTTTSYSNNYPMENFATVVFLPHEELAMVEDYVKKYTKFSVTSLVLFCFIKGAVPKGISITLSVLIEKTSIRDCFEAYSLKGHAIWRNLFFTHIETSLLIHYLTQYTLPNWRHNFEGVVVAGFAQDAVLEVEAALNSHGITFTGGMQVDEYFYLRDALNFSVKAIMSKDSLSESNGVLHNSGLVKILNNGEADLCIIPHELVVSRISGPYRIKFLHPTFYVKSLAVFVQPPMSFFRNIYLHPFQQHVWIALFLTCVTSYGILYFGTNLSNRLQLSYDYDRPLSSDTLIWVITVLTQRSLHHPPQWIFLRICCFVSFIVSLIIYTAYSSNLISILFIGNLPIKSIQDLVSADYTMHFNKYSPAIIPILQTLLHNKTTTDRKLAGLSIQEALPLINATRSAFLTQADAFYYLYNDGFTIEDLCNDLSLVPISQLKSLSAMFVKHGSEFREIFNRILIQIQERGVKERLIRYYNSKATLICAARKLSTTPMEMADTYSAFLFLLLSAPVCISIYLIENMFYCRRSTKHEIKH